MAPPLVFYFLQLIPHKILGLKEFLFSNGDTI